ncbi:hypothetical protein E4T42_02015 [Aureobasidium subglaciale]|nr:hypothetical protein E4T42_02015 [Aureobasidium subglaciale]
MPTTRRCKRSARKAKRSKSGYYRPFTDAQLARITETVTKESIKTYDRGRAERRRNNDNNDSGDEVGNTVHIVNGWDVAAILSLQDKKRYPHRPKLPSGQYFPFLQLPFEIRNMVYKELLVVGKVFQCPKPEDDTDKYNHPEVQLFGVSRQFLQESAPIFFFKNQFVCSYGTYKLWTNSWPKWMAPSIDEPEEFPISAMALKHVRSLSISYDSRDVELDPGFIRACVARETKLNPSFVLHNEKFEDDLNDMWQERGRILNHLQLDRLEVSMKNCYCALCFQRQTHVAIMELFGSVCGSPPKTIIISGLEDATELRRLKELTDIFGAAEPRLHFEFADVWDMSFSNRAAEDDPSQQETAYDDHDPQTFVNQIRAEDISRQEDEEGLNHIAAIDNWDEIDSFILRSRGAVGTVSRPIVLD